MILLVLLAQRINLILFMYFSIVLLRAACASRDKASASLMMTTEIEVSGRFAVYND
jgi:hypothetical protein